VEAAILARLGNTGIRLSEWLSRTRGRIVGMVLAAAFWQVSHGLVSAFRQRSGRKTDDSSTNRRAAMGPIHLRKAGGPGSIA
jgi:hypothetical protein